jgi:hypothetical protein
VNVQDVGAQSAVVAQTPARLDSLMRAVNIRIAAGSRIDLVALACECNSRECEQAVEVPVRIFDVVNARQRFFIVRPGHEEQFVERVVRRDRAYTVVERS